LATADGVAEVDEEARDRARLLGPHLDVVPGEQAADRLHRALDLARFGPGHRDGQGLEGGGGRPRIRLGIGLAAPAEGQDEETQSHCGAGARNHRPAVYRNRPRAASSSTRWGPCRKMTVWPFSARR